LFAANAAVLGKKGVAHSFGKLFGIPAYLGGIELLFHIKAVELGACRESGDFAPKDQALLGL
jgi:hypothetical protein